MVVDNAWNKRGAGRAEKDKDGFKDISLYLRTEAHGEYVCNDEKNLLLDYKDYFFKMPSAQSAVVSRKRAWQNG